MHLNALPNITVRMIRSNSNVILLRMECTSCFAVLLYIIHPPPVSRSFKELHEIKRKLKRLCEVRQHSIRKDDRLQVSKEIEMY